MVQPETYYPHDRPSPISRTNQAFRKGARPSVSSRILKRRILDVRRRDVAAHIDLFQSLDQLGFGCLSHGAHIPQMMSNKRLSKCPVGLPTAEPMPAKVRWAKTLS